MPSPYHELKERAWAANQEIPRRGLAIYTFGNVSALDAARGVMAIKPSGVEYEKLGVDDLVVVDLAGKIVEGKLRPSSDTPTHLVLYRSFAAVGGIWLMYLLGYNLSVAVAVGFIALVGVAAETGVVMLVYLDRAWSDVTKRCRIEGRSANAEDLREAIMHGAVLRVRPKMMTVVAIMASLLPIMWGTGTGSEVMRRIAAPMVGGMASATILTLVVIPAVYALVKERGLARVAGASAADSA